MRINFLIFLVACSLYNKNFAQNLITKWAYTYGNLGYSSYAYDVTTNQLGHHITAGSIIGNAADPAPDINPSSSVFTTNLNVPNDFYISTYDANGNFLSAFIVGGTGVDICSDVETDNANNIIACGRFQNTVDFDPGPGTTTLTSNGGDDIFLAKYTPAGNLIWVRSFGSTTNETPNQIFVDNLNNIFMTGAYNGTMDIDPSLTVNNLVSNGNSDMFVARFDASGNLIFGKTIGGTGLDNALDFTFDTNKNIYLTGIFVGTVDFDPSVSTNTVSEVLPGNTDIFFAKYDSILNFQWVKVIGQTQPNQPRDIKLDNTGNILLSGFMNSIAIDIDPSAATFTVGQPGYDQHGFIAKYNNSGNFIIGGAFGGTGLGYELTAATNIWSDAVGNIYSVGRYRGVVDFDLSASSNTLSSTSGSAIYYVKYSPGLVIQELKSLTTGFAYANNSHVDIAGNILVTGWKNLAISLNPSGLNSLQLPHSAIISNIYHPLIAKFAYCNTPTISAINSSSNNICAGTSLTLNVSGSLNGAANWLWLRGSCNTNTLGTGNSIVVTPTSNTVYHVKGQGGCAGDFLSCNTISITTIPQPTINVANSSSTICVNQNFTLTASGAITYTWANSNTTNSIVSSITTQSIFTVVGTNSLGCNTTKTISINPATVTPISINPNPNSNDTLCIGTPISLVASGAVSYFWNSPPPGALFNTVFIGAGNFVFSMSVNTLSTSTIFTVTGNHSNGCPSTNTILITYNSCLGLNENSLEEDKLSIQPNPTIDELTIKTNLLFNKIEITNSLGQVVISRDIDNNESMHKLKLDDLSKGVYYISIYSKNALLSTKKIIKQ